MDSVFLLLALVSAGVFAVTGVVFLIKKALKKQTKAGIVALAAAGGSMAFLFAFFACTNLSDSFFLLAALAAVSIPALLIAALVKRIRKQKRLKLWIAIVVLAAVVVGAYQLSNYVWSREALQPENIEVQVETDYDFDVVDGDKPLPVITSAGFDTPNSRFRNVYDRCDLPLLAIKTDVTEQDCLDALTANQAIDNRFKPFFSDFIHRFASQYPDADLSILYRNLSTLKVAEISKHDYITKSYNLNSYGCYRLDENAIYIPQGTVYKEGEWGFQVLIHEFCHACRSSWQKDEATGVSSRIQFQTVSNELSNYNRTILEEAMNSAFSCSLLNYYENHKRGDVERKMNRAHNRAFVFTNALRQAVDTRLFIALRVCRAHRKQVSQL